MERRYLVIIPSYNTGARLRSTVESALAEWETVWVVIDGSTDGSESTLDSLLLEHPGLKRIVLTENQGKGGAVLVAVKQALAAGFTDALLMDADGQHPADKIQPMMSLARSEPGCLLMGQPVFGPEVPKARLYGRRLTIFWTELETLYVGLGDTLFGMRVYPLEPFVRVMESSHFARGYDFDPEVAVKLVWAGVQPRQMPVPVRYFSEAEGGVSHFHYLRDNVKLTILQFRLMFLFVFYGWYRVLWAKKKWQSAPVNA